MNTAQKILNDSCKPKYGLKYKHFTQEEMVYITNYNKCNYKTRFIRIKNFISKHKNLEEFEDKIKNCDKLSSEDDSPFSYIAHLISYGRIIATYEVIRRIISHCYKELYYEGSPFINIQFIESFNREGERLGYCRDRMERAFRELIIISIFYKVQTEQIPNIFGEYLEFCNQRNVHTNSITSMIYNILSSMGYNLLEAGISLNSSFKRQYVSANMSQEFLDGLEEYIKWYSEKADSKTVKCVRSHIMVFFNYLSDTYPDIKKLSLIENKHINSFMESQLKTNNFFGRSNTPETINARTEAISRVWKFFIQKNKYSIISNIVTFDDKIKESKKFPIYISRENIFKLKKALMDIEDDRYLQLKYLLIILLDTGRRIHEVLSLEYNCLNTINGIRSIHFHKFKGDKPPRNIPISESCEIAVLQLRNMANNFRRPLKSKHDNLSVRRLFPSIKFKGSCVLTEKCVKDLFDEFQVINNIVNHDGKPIFKIHDIKRTFVSNLLAKGCTALEISKFLKQEINSLLPYEANNETAIKTLKLAEERGLLIGKGFSNEYDSAERDDNIFKTRVIELLKNTDVSNRHKENLLYKLTKPQEVVPLFLGECTDKDSILVCGTLICMACDEILSDSINSCEEFFIKIYKYIYKNIRNKGIKDIEQQFKIACENIYIKKEKMSETEMKTRINSIKKQAREEIKAELKEEDNDEKGR